MQYLFRLRVWYLRAWPALLLLPVIAVHFGALALFPCNSEFVNKLTGTALQVAGGVIVLLSLDGNLGLFKKQSLLGTFILWIKEFPRSGNQTNSLGGVAFGVTLTGTATLTTRPKPATTVEERLAELERRVAEECDRLNRLERSTSEKIQRVRTELSQSISQVDSSLRDLASKVESTSIGGLKQQLFGVLLALYGALVSVFA